MPENNDDFINKFLVSEYNSEDNMNYYVKIKKFKCNEYIIGEKYILFKR